MYEDVTDITATTDYQTIWIDLNQSGSAPFATKALDPVHPDFTLRMFFESFSETDLPAIYMPNEDGSINTFNGFYMERFAEGETIGPDSGGTWEDSVELFLTYEGIGPWATGGQGYLGVRIEESPGQFHYGWLNVTYSAVEDTVTLHDFAYNTTPNQTIAAGAVPEPSALVMAGVAALAMGWLRRRR